MDKNAMKASNGVPLTQSLFLEIGYSDLAVYTLKDDDYEYNGKLYPSLKKLYLEMEDVTEYVFATECLLGWNHWQRLCDNKQVAKHISEWRYELELKLRAKAFQQIINKAKVERGISAAKWLAEKGWDRRSGAGRPSKADIERNIQIETDIERQFMEDLKRLEGN